MAAEFEPHTVYYLVTTVTVLTIAPVDCRRPLSDAFQNGQARSLALSDDFGRPVEPFTLFTLAYERLRQSALNQPLRPSSPFSPRGIYRERKKLRILDL
jgi:hypothetical protein